MDKEHHDLIYGKDKTENIVSIEIVDDKIVLFREVNGEIITETRDNKYWLLAPRPSKDGRTKRLEGDQFFKYIKEYDTRSEFEAAKKHVKTSDLYCIYNPVEGAMVRHGYTFFKNTKMSDVSVLSFDIETSGLNPKAKDAQIFLISNSFRKMGKTETMLFSIDEYESEREMLLDWVRYVQYTNPSIVLGYNINGFDFGYLIERANKFGITLDLGRDGSAIKVENFERKIRKDGSQEYPYKRIHIFGRSIIDGFFVAIRYDIGRKYSSYKLKTIIAEENMEKEGRVFVDAGKIKDEWKDLEKRELIKQYAEADADDALKLYDLMIPAQFYLCQYIPKTMQIITESASGSQLNLFLVRAYLQLNGSIPKSSETCEYEGGISRGYPGIYRKCLKLDVKSMYPSIMISYNIYDEKKDPCGYFFSMVKTFTEKRLKNKELAKKTKNRYYEDLEKSEKQIINSAYGLLGAPGLNFNNSKKASFVTEKAREILILAVKWATGSEDA